MTTASAASAAMTGRRASPIVVKLGGLAIEDPHGAGELLGAVALLHRTDRAGVVLVHGGGKAVDDHLGKLGLTSEKRRGLRVTTPEQIEEIVAVLAGRVNKAIVGALQGHGVASVGLCLGDGLTAVARRLTPEGEDIGLVGEVTGGDPRLLRILLAERYLPVVSPIAMDQVGRPLNVNGDDAAGAVAAIIGARLLVLLTDVPCILGEGGRPLARTDETEIGLLIDRGIISGGMIPKAKAALKAARVAGVPTVIASWKQPELLGGIARGETIGTCIMPLEPVSMEPQADGSRP